MHVAEDELRRLLRVCSSRWTEDAVDIEAYLARQVSDDSHREVIAVAGHDVVVLLREAGRRWVRPSQVSEMESWCSAGTAQA